MTLRKFLVSRPRDRYVARSPIFYDDVQVSLERHDHASSTRRAELLVALSAQEFPLNHWNARFIRQAFQGFGSVIEIDWRCVRGSDYSSVRVVVQVDEVARVPGELWIRDVSTGACDICLLQLVRAWPRAESFGADGRYIPFFGLPPPPPRATPRHQLPSFLPAPPRHLAPGPQRPPQATPLHAYIAYIVRSVLLALLQQPQSHLLPPLPPFPIVITTSTLTYTSSLQLCSPSVCSPAKALAPAEPCVPDTPPRCNPVTPDLWGMELNHEASVCKERVRAKRAADLSAKHKKSARPAIKRFSARLRAKEPAEFEDMSTKASRLKAMKNKLTKCSKDLQNQVKRRGLLHKRAMNAADLRALAGTASLSDAATAKLNKTLLGLG